MIFDVIVGNPPYQISLFEKGAINNNQSIPIYHLFVEQTKRINLDYISLIIPSRWFAGGLGLTDFRNAMLNDNRIKRIIDYVNSKDCFDSLSIGGGCSILLWDKNYLGFCLFTSIYHGKENTTLRKLNEFPIFIRYNEAISIIHKILFKSESTFDSLLLPRNPFGIPTNIYGSHYKKENSILLVSSKGDGYIELEEVKNNKDIVDHYKVMVTRVMSEHGGEPDKNGRMSVISRIRVLNPSEVCTDSYLIIDCQKDKNKAYNIASYLKNKFTRFLLLQSTSSINLSKNTYRFIPIQEFSKPWTDNELYEKYNLTKEEIEFIESMIKPMN